MKGWTVYINIIYELMIILEEGDPGEHEKEVRFRLR